MLMRGADAVTVPPVHQYTFLDGKRHASTARVQRMHLFRGLRVVHGRRQTLAGQMAGLAQSLQDLAACRRPPLSPARQPPREMASDSSAARSSPRGKAGA